MSITWEHVVQYSKQAEGDLDRAIRRYYLGTDASTSNDLWTAIEKCRDWNKRSSRDELLYVVENSCGKKYAQMSKMAQCLRLLLGYPPGRFDNPHYPYHSIEFTIIRAANLLSVDGRKYLARCYGRSGNHRDDFEDYVVNTRTGKHDWSDPQEVKMLLNYIRDCYNELGEHGCGALEILQNYRIPYDPLP